MVDKRRRNSRPSKYRPRSEAQKQRRRELWEARAQARQLTTRQCEEAALRARLDELEAAMRDVGRVGVHNRRHTIPLDEIDDEQRFHVLKARVERLEALWSIGQRKRETRGKIIIGGALLAEAADEMMIEGRSELLERLVDIIDRRVDHVRDRLTVRELLGDAPLPLRPGGALDEGPEEALAATGESLPDFDAMAESALADAHGEDLVPSEIDPDYADLDASWRRAG
ncbi:MAG: hypothetical protein JO127_06995 [Caulobacteraceae bacterium]|nr:hypothetical protein [Caulobacteraceae bacterium]